MSLKSYFIVLRGQESLNYCFWIEMKKVVPMLKKTLHEIHYQVELGLSCLCDKTCCIALPQTFTIKAVHQ